MDSEFTYGLQIAGISLALKTDHPLPREDAFLPFQAENICPQYTAEFCRTDSLRHIPDEILYEDAASRVHPDGHGGFFRSFYDGAHSTEPYGTAVYLQADKTVRIDYLEEGASCVSEFTNSFYHIGLEALLIREEKVCFHAALVQTPQGGILFSGPSGIGKSTQAELWCRCGQGRLINGDRPILGKKGGIWTAWGSPYAGSSRCYVNESCPIAAVILLKQKPQCSIRRLNAGERFRGLFTGFTVNQWNPQFVDAAMTLAEDLSGSVPVLEFSCTPAAEAVDFLKSYLERELKL